MNTRHVLPKSRFSLCLLLLGGSTSGIFASQISFTHSGIGSGSIGGIPFTSAAFSISELADTANRVSFLDSGTSGFFINDTSATITITGLGLFHFTSSTRTFVNNSIGVVGFSRGSDFTDLFDGPNSSLFNTWNMLTPIGPITGTTGKLTQWSLSPVTTDGGVLLFSDARPISATFQATLVPEPCGFALSIAAFACLAVKSRAGCSPRIRLH